MVGVISDLCENVKLSMLSIGLHFTLEILQPIAIGWKFKPQNVKHPM